MNIEFDNVSPPELKTTALEMPTDKIAYKRNLNDRLQYERIGHQTWVILRLANSGSIDSADAVTDKLGLVTEKSRISPTSEYSVIVLATNISEGTGEIQEKGYIVSTDGVVCPMGGNVGVGYFLDAEANWWVPDDWLETSG